MGREIKFRALDTKESKYLEWNMLMQTAWPKLLRDVFESPRYEKER